MPFHRIWQMLQLRLGEQTIQPEASVQPRASDNTVPPTNDTRPFPFLKLPTELRFCVYQFLFEGFELKRTSFDNPRLRIPGILGVCNLVRTEAMGILYKSSTIHIKIQGDGFDFMDEHVTVLDESRIGDITKPIRDIDACCDLLWSQLLGMFRNFRKVRIAVDHRYAFHPGEWGNLVEWDRYDSHYTESQVLRFEFQRGNRPYNLRQIAQTLAKCLQYFSRVHELTISLDPVCPSLQAEVLMLEAFAGLRNVGKVHIDVLEDFEGIEDDPGISSIIALIKGNSKVTVNADQERMEDDYLEMADFLQEFRRKERGPWVDEVWEPLFDARVALYNSNQTEFEKHRRAFLSVWDKELERRRKEEDRVSHKFMYLKTKAGAQAE